MLTLLFQQPSYDPNWFYSSLSQAAAALIGLLGGIMATRLDSQVAQARKARTEFHNSIFTVNNKVEELWPLVQSRSPQLAELVASLASLQAATTLPKLRDSATKLSASSKGTDWEQWGVDLHRHVAIASGVHADLRRKADSRVYERLLIVLGVLSFAGLLAPLLFLSAHTGWSKGVLLGGFALGVLGLLVFIAWQVRYLRRVRTVSLMFDR